MEPLDPRRRGSVAKIIDKCVECGEEIVVEVETHKLEQGQVWVERLCASCAGKRQWQYE